MGLNTKEAIKLARSRTWLSNEVAAVEQIHRNVAEDTYNFIKNYPSDPTQRTPEMLAEFQARMTKYADILTSTSQMKSEVGRALAIQRRMKTYQPEFGKQARAEKLVKEVIKSGDQEKINAAIDSMKNLDFDDPRGVAVFLRGLKKAKTSDHVYRLFYDALLSSPITHEANMIGNTATTFLKYPERALAATIDLFRAGITRTPRERFFTEIGSDMVAIPTGLKNGFRSLRGFFQTGITEEMASKMDIGAVPQMPGILEKIRPTTLMQGADEFAKGFIYSTEKVTLATRQALKEGVKGDALKTRIAQLMRDESISEKAWKEAEYRTFQNSLGRIGNHLMALRNYAIPGTNIKPFVPLVPFIKTGTNIAKFTMERTPLSFPWAAGKRSFGLIKGGEFSDELAKGVLGSSIMATAYILAQEGYLTGGGSKNKWERQERLRLGITPYSLKLNLSGKDYYVPFNRYEPVGSLLGLAADYKEILDRNGSEEEKQGIASAMAGSVAKNITSKTFWQGFSRLVDATSDPEKYGEKWVEGFITTPIPSVSGYLARASDPYYREPETIPDVIKSKIPFLSETNYPLINIWGEPVERVGTTLSKLLVPGSISEAKSDPVDEELRKLKLNLGLPGKKIGDYELQKDEWRDMVYDGMQKAKVRLNYLVGTDSFQNMKDKQKESSISKIVDDERNKAKLRMKSKLTLEGKTFKKQEQPKVIRE